jgi:Cu-Zn family superoxide dismutase
MNRIVSIPAVFLFVCVGPGIRVGSVHAQDGLPLPSNGKLVVAMANSRGDHAGTATFKENKAGTELTISLNLKNVWFGQHAVIIHANPVCDAPDFKGAGGHFNPDGKQHGTQNPMGHHNGDLGKNISIGEDHTGELTVKVDYLTLVPGTPTSVLGHSIIVHEKADDMMTDPTGNAGNRIACGVIRAVGM